MLGVHIATISDLHYPSARLEWSRTPAVRSRSWPTLTSMSARSKQ
jgi:hypothetical protein